MKHLKKAVSALALIAATPATAQTVATYDFDFTIAYSGNASFAVGSTGTGRFSFQEAPMSEATVANGWYGHSAAYLDVTYNGVTTRLVTLSGNLSGMNGPIMQDISPPMATYDIFSIRDAFATNYLNIYGLNNSITDYDLTAANLDKLWANPPSTGRGDIQLGTYSAFGRITALRAVSGVPEPATWGMMVLGFGFVGGVLRRRPVISYSVA